jgi:hypothetical protein
MKEKTTLRIAAGNIDRRSMVKSGAVLVGAGFLETFTKAPDQPGAQPAGNIFNVKDFGATGNRDDKATGAIRNAVDACAAAGGGMVYIPPGDYTVGTIQLKDNVTLHIEAGATLFLSQDRDDFIRGVRSMIFAEDASNISVTGKGTLDGLAQYEFAEMRGIDPEIAEEIEIAREAGTDMRRYYRTGMQTYMFILNNCTNVLLRDISVINSPLWNIRLNDCDRVFIRGIYIFSDLEKGVNADGIDICSSRNVTISDSVIITADDSIVLKTPLRSGQEQADTTENIVVNNCVLTSSSTPLMIGTETHADVRHVVFSNCTIRNSNKGFGINVQDGAMVSDIIINNLTIETSRRHWNWWGSAELCKIVLKKREESSRLGKIRDIVITNILSHTRGTSTIKGHQDRPLENIRMSNVQIFMDPEDATDKRATHAMVIENVRELDIRDLSVRWAGDQTEKNWQSALVLKNVSGFDVWSFSGRQGLINSSYPAIRLENVSEGQISDSRATAGCGAFIHFAGEKTRQVALRNNNTKKAVTDISYENEQVKRAVEAD